MRVFGSYFVILISLLTFVPTEYKSLISVIRYSSVPLLTFLKSEYYLDRQIAMSNEDALDEKRLQGSLMYRKVPLFKCRGEKGR